MRDIIIILLILILIITGDTIVQKHLDSSSESLISDLQELKEKTITTKEHGDREEIIELMEKAEQNWELINEKWCVIIMHDEIDNIEESMTKTKSSIKDGQLEEALEEIETAMFFINHVKEREEISWKNIF